MRKFSRIVEGKEEEFFLKLGTTKAEIDDVFTDLYDYGYYMDIEDVYISTTTGYPHRSPKEAKEFYPGIEIDIKRNLADDDDFRKWNGGVYYEPNFEVIEAIYSSIYRVQSMFKDKGQVYYSLRSVNEISFRIIFNTTKNDEPIDYESIDGHLSNMQGERIGTQDIQDYTINRTWSTGKTKFSVEISPVKERGGRISHKGVNIIDPQLPSDFIVKHMIDLGKSDNKYKLRELGELYVKEFYKKCNHLNRLDINRRSDTQYGELRYDFTDSETDRVILKIRTSYEDYAEDVPVVVSRGIFKNKITKVNLYKLEINIEVVK